jgi:tRNA pseudouridine32 synthase / 23S rRNA pseudouridine746 synthase
VWKHSKPVTRLRQPSKLDPGLAAEAMPLPHSGLLGDIVVIHVDEDVIVVLKPAGLLAVPGRGADKQDCCSASLAQVYGPLHIVHRLDQATSGLMLFARNAFTLKNLHQQFALRSVHKRYEALVHGQVQPQAFEINLPLSADWPNRPKQKVDLVNGKVSCTQVQLLSFGSTTQCSRVSLVPKTGRTHQLRVHLQAIGHPILGDALYGDAQSADRLMLHACELGFQHPVTHEKMQFTTAPEF